MNNFRILQEAYTKVTEAQDLSKTVIELKSVGTALNTKTGDLHPMEKTGKYDDFDSVNLGDAVNDWFSGLDDGDRKIVSNTMKKLKIKNDEF